jgi:acyl carrier protein
MADATIDTLAQYIAAKVLRKPGRLIRPDEALVSSGMVDSFSLVDLAIFVEQTFGVRIDDTELNAQSFDTLSQLVALIEKRKK